GGRSLLWAIDPLQSVPEGGVSILSLTAEDQARLSAQLDVLDPMLRPELLLPELLLADNSDVDHVPEDLQFEWIGGRLSNQDLANPEVKKLFNAITHRCSQQTGLRLLVSHSEIGPAEAMLQMVDDQIITAAERALLNPLIEQEQHWLKKQRQELHLDKELKRLGWQLEWESWAEVLSLQVDEELEQRWLGDGRPYRTLLAKDSPTEALKTLEGTIRKLRGQQLPQKLIHQRLIGRRQAD
ncbi:MAG: recombination protein RarA, partial [Prochlorococcus sp.]|nr:recombination protein RarA [Prochlorococcus sp.]